jgi:copper chaperone CopZ
LAGVPPANSEGITLTRTDEDHRAGTEGAGWRPVEAILDIGGMTCGACVARIERKLNALDGVTARVNLTTERAVVTMPPGMAVDDLVDQVESIGFSAAVRQ